MGWKRGEGEKTYGASGGAAGDAGAEDIVEALFIMVLSCPRESRGGSHGVGYRSWTRRRSCGWGRGLAMTVAEGYGLWHVWSRNKGNWIKVVGFCAVMVIFF